MRGSQQAADDEVDMVMPADQWEAFCNALDRPAKEIRSLKQLMSRWTVFDEAEQGHAS
jgi:hypothetical protein